ncbi:pectinesterase inhibitor 7-like [Pyrus x bretschneideri]|uniref:pectinesterase inhibitor 7-like n=1 Tax=Pyrus x bretschneideri TaxID=225117 RepID=UPI00202E16CF|nr:pectinesterase inhibitor 7-like [Pyrus x bretschneideri]
MVYGCLVEVARLSSSTDFIKASCRTTQYPALCVQSLAAYTSAIRQSERQLAQTALTVSLARLRSAASFVAKLTRVRQIKPRDNVETWVSAAFTDEGICLDGF